jgi:hypothetical protein
MMRWGKNVKKVSSATMTPFAATKRTNNAKRPRFDSAPITSTALRESLGSDAIQVVIPEDSRRARFITTIVSFVSANEIRIVFLSVLIMGAPGSKLGEVVALRLDALVRAKACTIFYILSTSLASALLMGPRGKHLTPIFGICWGLALGWLHPMHSTLFIAITPAGPETELMSVYLFCGQVLSWLPPLLFTILNEVGVSMSIGLALLNVFFVIGLVCLHNIGNYNVASDQARLRQDLVPSGVHTDGSDTNGGEVSLPPIL